MEKHLLDLKALTGLTLEHYNERALEFWQGTRGHDVRQNINALLEHIHGTGPFTILDFGCGPGRDLREFTDLGHVVGIREVRLDGTRTGISGVEAEFSGTR